MHLLPGIPVKIANVYKTVAIALRLRLLGGRVIGLCHPFQGLWVAVETLAGSLTSTAHANEILFSPTLFAMPDSHTYSF